MENKNKLNDIRKKIFTVIDVNSNVGFINRFYDFFSTAVLIVNILVVTLNTVNSLHAEYGHFFEAVEAITVAFFAIDCILRLFTAKNLHPECSNARAILKYVFSFDGIVDILSFLPYYLPVFFPSGMAVFRFFRVVRIFRLFRINAYYDSLNVITEVLKSKKMQLVSSAFIILVLMLASSLCMYSVENAAQPEVFSNAFSGIWWSVSTLLTIGYGDIYPITPLGQVLGIIISFLGVGMVAIPTGIISAGFVDQYSRIKKLSEYGRENDVNFIKIELDESDDWVGKQIKDIKIPKSALVALVIRGNGTIIPRGNVVLNAKDTIILAADFFHEEYKVEFKEIQVAKNHPWVGESIASLDISKKTLIVLIRRNETSIVPRGDVVIKAGDKLLLFTKLSLKDAQIIEI